MLSFMRERSDLEARDAIWRSPVGGSLLNVIDPLPYRKVLFRSRRKLRPRPEASLRLVLGKRVMRVDERLQPLLQHMRIDLRG